MRIFLAVLITALILTACGSQPTTQPNIPTEVIFNVKVDPVELANFFNTVTQKEGAIRAPEWSSVHTLLIPDSSEVDINELDIEFMKTLASTLMTGGGFTNGKDINLVFTSPKDHKIMVVNRKSNVPEILLKVQEISFDPRKGELVTIINLGGPQKELGSKFTRSWAYAQTMCLSYAYYVPNSDPQCNLFAANAAAAWAGIPRDKAEAWINALGKTSMNADNLTYRFIPSIYDVYKH